MRWMDHRRCLTCQADISRIHHNAKRCKPCAARYKTERLAKYAAGYEQNYRERGGRSKAGRTPLTRHCLMCQADITPLHRAAKRCEPCADLHERARNARNTRRYRERNGRIHQSGRCMECGAETNRRAAKRCVPCEESAHRVRARKATRKYRERNPAPRPVRYCADCDRDISERDTRALRCVDCAPIHNAEMMRARLTTPESLAKRRANYFKRGGKWPRRALLLLIEEQHGLCGNYLKDKGCWGCNKPLDHTAEVDHIIPTSKHGSSELRNLQALHAACNNWKRAKVRAQLGRAGASRTGPSSAG